MRKIITFLIFVLLFSSLILADKEKEFDNSHGSITFKEELSEKDKEKLDEVSVNWGIISIDTEKNPELDKPATIIFKDFCALNPIILNDGIWDPSITAQKTGYCEITADVPHFSTWQITDNTFNGTFYNMTTYSNGSL